MMKPITLCQVLAVGFLAAFAATLWPVPSADAQQRQRVYTSPPPETTVRGNRGGIGGYSTTMSDVWGPAKMPPAPKDFGPHFDFQPDNLGQGLSHSPYPD